MAALTRMEQERERASAGSTAGAEESETQEDSAQRLAALTRLEEDRSSREYRTEARPD